MSVGPDKVDGGRAGHPNAFVTRVASGAPPDVVDQLALDGRRGAGRYQTCRVNPS